MSGAEHTAASPSRRQFLRLSGSLGAAAVASLQLRDSGQARAQLHFPARAKRVVFLFQSGAPSQVDLLDPKPQLRRLQGQDLPESIRQGQRLTGMTAAQARFPVAASKFRFRPHGRSGLEFSELLPHIARQADDLCVIRSLHTEAINHDPAITFCQTGAQLAGRPSIGAWLSYGLGTMNEDLPAFVAMVSGSGGQPLYDRLWGSGFLPARYQGTKFQSQGDPVPYLSNPDGVDREMRRRMVDDLTALNQLQLDRAGHEDTLARIEQYQLAFRMQSSVPSLADVSGEPEHVLRLYGDDARQPGTFAHNCLLARRLLERDVRFVQLFHRGWDQHRHLPEEIGKQCAATDQASAALVADLRQRGMLDDTLVVWGGEFGRTVYCQGSLTADDYGRDHHPRCFSIWMTGGGVKGGQVHGATDDYSYNITESPLSVHDLHATMLHLLGIDHLRLTHKFQGRDYRLTDVHGRVVDELIA